MQHTWQQRNAPAGRIEEARALGATPLQARILAGRLPEPTTDLRHTLFPRDHVLRWEELPDIRPAAARIADAIQRREVIAACVDHDADGVTSCLVIRESLVKHFGVDPALVHSVCSHRTREGYGVSSKLVERVLALSPRPTLVITADQGSADEDRIRVLRDEHQIETVVSDHHAIPLAGVPRSAVACVNPARTDIPCRDPAIAGCMVAYYMMSAVRDTLIERGHLPTDAPKLASVLDAAAVGTTADAVNLGASATNRFVVKAGLARMNALKRPIWRAMEAFVPRPWDAQTIAFKIGSITNAHGRMDDGTAGLDAYTTDDEAIAHERVAVMIQANERRKEVERALSEEAVAQGRALAEQGAGGIAIILKRGHPGVHGICASRVVEQVGRATVCLSPHMTDEGILTGSARSVPGINVKHVLDRITQEHPGLVRYSGGHSMAAGVGVLAENGAAFCAAWDSTITDMLDGAAPAMTRWHDGPLGSTLGALALDEIAALEPYGRGFELPVFCDDFTLRAARPVGDGSHLRLELTDVAGRNWAAIWFRALAPGQAMPVSCGVVRLVYSLHAPGPRSRQAVELHVEGRVVA